MRSRFTYVNDTVIEVIVDGDSLTWNVLAPKRSPSPVPAPEPLLVAAPEPEAVSPLAPAASGSPLTGETAPLRDMEAPVAPLGALEAPVCLDAPLTRKRRTLMASIRAMWTLVFGFVGEAAVYVLDNLGVLDLPPGTGVALGAVLYGIKRYAKPEGLL